MDAQTTIPLQKRQLLLGSLLALSFLLYANCAFNGFVFDDHSQIEHNPWVHSFKYTGKLFGTSLLAQQGKQAAPNFYRPTVNFGFLVCYKLFGTSPFGFHLVNIFLNCIVVWLVFRVGSELFSSEWLAFIAALIFALHPIHTEPVAWIDGISDPEVTVFYLLTFLLFLRLSAPQSQRSVWLWPAMLGTFLLALLAKEPAMTFPVLATVYEHFYRSDHENSRATENRSDRDSIRWSQNYAALDSAQWAQNHSDRDDTARMQNRTNSENTHATQNPANGENTHATENPANGENTHGAQNPANRENIPRKQKVARYAGFWILLFAYLGLRAASVGRLAPADLHTDISTREMLFSALALIGQYAKKLVWPWPLIAFYPFQKSEHLREPQVLLGFAVVLLFVLAFVLLWKRARPYSFVLLWMCLTIAPALNVRWMTASVFAERYLYLPSVGFSWLLAGALVWLWNRAEQSQQKQQPQQKKQQQRQVLDSTRGAPWGAVRWSASRWTVFRSGTVAAGAALAVLASYAIVTRNREWRSDLDLVTSSLATQPESAHMHAEYGMIQWGAGDHDAAEREWQLALHYNPDSAEALANLGFARFEEKRYDEATTILQRTIALKPRFAAPHIQLGKVYGAEGKNDLAEAEFLRALEIHPTNTVALNALGEFYLQQGRLAEAAEQLRRSVEIYSDVRTWSNLGEIYDRENQPEQARAAWEQVLTFESFNPHAHRSLGQIYLSHEQWALAQNEFQMCLLMDQKDSVALAGLEKIRAATRGTKQ